MSTHSAKGGMLTAQADGKKLKELRGDQKQEQVAQACGIPRGQMTRFETGKPVGIKYLLKLAEYYKIQPKELLAEEGIQSTSELLTDLARLRGVKIDFSAQA